MGKAHSATETAPPGAGPKALISCAHTCHRSHGSYCIASPHTCSMPARPPSSQILIPGSLYCTPSTGLPQYIGLIQRDAGSTIPSIRLWIRNGYRPDGSI
jgi:hypothetical protein